MQDPQTHHSNQEKGALTLISFRPIDESDLNFIYQTWLNSVCHGNAILEFLSPDFLKRKFHQVIDQIIKDKATEIKIACLKDDHETIVGFSIFTYSVLHYVFVRPKWRRIKIATRLLPAFNTVTTTTDLGRDILKEKYPHIRR